MRRATRSTRGAVAAILLLAGVASGASACKRAEPAPVAMGSQATPNPGAERAAAAPAAIAGAGGALAVPHVSGPIKIDGEVDEPDWTAAGRTGAFTDGHGTEARPFSEARFLWDEKNLYVTLYAADDDIRAQKRPHDAPVWIDDAFSLRLTPGAAGAPTYLIDVSAAGVVMDARRGADGKIDPSWESGMVLALDSDGSLNDPSDEDEEWVIEAAIPLAALGVTPAAGARLAVEIARCDTPRHTTARRCGSYGTARERRVLELGGR